MSAQPTLGEMLLGIEGLALLRVLASDDRRLPQPRPR